MNSTTKAATAAPLVVLNSYGFSGAETLATYLASHVQIGLLPGQNFIQQNNNLYRPLRIPENDANTCFELLATKQYTKAGVQWAGLGKFMAPAYAARYSLATHKTGFIAGYERLSSTEKKRYTSVVKCYIESFFDCMGEDSAAFQHYGFYGSNLLLNASAYPNFHRDVRILQVLPSPAQWLALASQSLTWNSEKALNFFTIQNLFIKHFEKSHDNIHRISFHRLITDTKNTLDNCCEFLNIAAWEATSPVSGQGHAPATQSFFDKIFDDAEKINSIYAGSFWYEIASNIDEWADHFLKDNDGVLLLEKYRAYWNSTSHIAFDWSGPLELQIMDLVQQHASKSSSVKSGVRNTSVAYQFYQKWYELNSIDHRAVVGDAMFPIGTLEEDIPLPKLQYFMRIAIHYIHTSVKLQGEKLHSYRSVKNAHLFSRLCDEKMQTSLDKNFLRDEFDAMQDAVNHTEELFREFNETANLNAALLAKANSSNQSVSPIARKITDEEIKAIAVSGPDVTEHESRLVAAAMDDWYQQPYYYCEEFERRFAKHHNRQFALMTPNCTAANHLLLMGLGIGTGDEVLVPEATWIASAAPAYYTGATPVYCDIDADDWCISIDSIKQNLTAKTRAIIAVNLYGNMAKMDELEHLANTHNLFLIEDAAESIGSVYKGRKSGEFGVGSLFSFHRTKTLTTGEGGILLVDDEALYRRCVKLRDHGRGPDTPAFTHDLVTHKYMPFNVQAALGLGQLERLDQLVDKKRHILHFYKERLARFEDLQLNPESGEVYNSAWCSTIILGTNCGYNKASLMHALQAERVPSRPFFYPLSSQPGIQKKLGGKFDFSMKNPTAFAISERGINLPSALNLSDAQLDYVCTVLEKLLDADQTDSAKRHTKAA